MIFEEQRETTRKEGIFRVLILITLLLFIGFALVQIGRILIFLHYFPYISFRVIDIILFVLGVIVYTIFIVLFIRNYKVTRRLEAILSIVCLMLAAVIMIAMTIIITSDPEFRIIHPLITSENAYYLYYIITAVLITISLFLSFVFFRKQKVEPKWKTTLFISSNLLSSVVIAHIILFIIIITKNLGIRLVVGHNTVMIALMCIIIVTSILYIVTFSGLYKEAMKAIQEKRDLEVMGIVSNEYKPIDIEEIFEEKEIILPKIIEEITIDKITFSQTLIICVFFLNFMNYLMCPIFFRYFMLGEILNIWFVCQMISIGLLVIVSGLSFESIYRKTTKNKKLKLIAICISLILAIAFGIVMQVIYNQPINYRAYIDDSYARMMTKLQYSCIIINLVFIAVAQFLFTSLLLQRRNYDRVIQQALLLIQLGITFGLITYSLILFLRNNSVSPNNGFKSLEAAMLTVSMLSTIGFYYPLMGHLSVLKYRQIMKEKIQQEDNEEKVSIKLLDKLHYDQNKNLAKSLVTSGMAIFAVRYIFNFLGNLGFVARYGTFGIDLEIITYYQLVLSFLASIIIAAGIRELQRIVQNRKQKRLLKTAFWFLILIMVFKFVFGFLIAIAVDIITHSFDAFWDWIINMLILSSIYTDIISLIIAFTCTGMVVSQLSKANLIDVKLPISPILLPAFILIIPMFIVDILPRWSLSDMVYYAPAITYSIVGLIISLETMIRFRVKSNASRVEN